jgi:hypothetical protein
LAAGNASGAVANTPLCEPHRVAAGTVFPIFGILGLVVDRDNIKEVVYHILRGHDDIGSCARFFRFQHRGEHFGYKGPSHLG